VLRGTCVCSINSPTQLENIKKPTGTESLVRTALDSLKHFVTTFIQHRMTDRSIAMLEYQPTHQLIEDQTLNSRPSTHHRKNNADASKELFMRLALANGRVNFKHEQFSTFYFVA
jgi:hypothetical protein